MEKNIIVFDIDGTLSLVGDRLKYLDQTPKDWDNYYEQCDEDLPNLPIMEIFRGLYRLHQYRFIFVTGRRESVRNKTLTWLTFHTTTIKTEDLYMRQDNDYRLDTVIKPEMIWELLPKVLMIFEDRSSVVKMWRNLGLTCLQVQKGNY